MATTADASPSDTTAWADYVHTGPGTLAGRYMRRFWQPVYCSAHLPPQRVALHRELLQEQMGDVALMPMYWRAGNAFVREGVRGVVSADTWNAYEWDVDRP
jgi:hypothetical protein